MFKPSLVTLQSKPITVKPRAGGEEVNADLIACGCGCEAFCVYMMGGHHQHLQCIDCAASYCDGTCGGRGRVN